MYYILFHKQRPETSADWGCSLTLYGRSAPRTPQPPFPPRGVGAFGCVRGPCPPGRCCLPPPVRELGTVLLCVGTKSWGDRSKRMKVTFVTPKMQNVYLILKCDAPREQQDCGQQVNHGPSRPSTPSRPGDGAQSIPQPWRPRNAGRDAGKPLQGWGQGPASEAPGRSGRSRGPRTGPAAMRGGQLPSAGRPLPGLASSTGCQPPTRPDGHCGP